MRHSGGYHCPDRDNTCVTGVLFIVQSETKHASLWWVSLSRQGQHMRNRGRRSGATTPPVTWSREPCTPKGRNSTIFAYDDVSELVDYVVAPLRGARPPMSCNRGVRRSAPQPPVTHVFPLSGNFTHPDSTSTSPLGEIIPTPVTHIHPPIGEIIPTPVTHRHLLPGK